MTAEASTTSGKPNSTPSSIKVILGESNRGMKGTRFPVTSVGVRDFRFESKGLLKERKCSTGRACDGGVRGFWSVSF